MKWMDLALLSLKRPQSIDEGKKLKRAPVTARPATLGSICLRNSKDSLTTSCFELPVSLLLYSQLAVLILASAAKAQTAASTPSGGRVPFAVTEFQTFADAKAAVLDQISLAKSSIQLYTELLTDGDIVSSLYLAKFRKVDTIIMLGAAQANSYLSRLRDLKKQDVPVYLAPGDFPRTPRTAIIVDNNDPLFLDVTLDYRAHGSRFTLKQMSGVEGKQYRESFAAAVGRNIVPVGSSSLPQVGKARYQSSPGRPGLPSRPTFPARRYNPSHPEAQGAYRYQYKRGDVPSYVPKTLPKETIWQRKKREKEEGAHPVPSGPAQQPAVNGPPQIPQQHRGSADRPAAGKPPAPGISDQPADAADAPINSNPDNRLRNGWKQ